MGLGVIARLKRTDVHSLNCSVYAVERFSVFKVRTWLRIFDVRLREAAKWNGNNGI